MIGEALGNYKITAKLGSGTMGVVFRADHARIARTVAIKVLAPELARDATVVQRFFNEARATSLIHHPGIVDVFDCDVDPTGRAYIVMEHLDGETLAEALRRTATVPWPAACAIARQIAEAVAAAHENGIVHRDLKPDNVFLIHGSDEPRRERRAKVLDFGIAKLMADPAMRLTMRGMLLGTPEYMAPEQCGGADEVDERADIYALGCMLFEMLSGEPPFLAERLQELIAAHMFRPVPAIGERVPGLPDDLADLITRMLAKRREDRPTSMHEVARTLAEAGKVAKTTTKTAAKTARTAWWRGRRAQIAVLTAGVCALAGAAWVAAAASRRAAPAAVAPVVEREAARVERPPAAAPPADVLPPAGVPPPLPPPREPAPAAERSQRPQRRARPAPQNRPAPQHVVDSDGIVDL
jgi:serine/threonine-protein kinase